MKQVMLSVLFTMVGLPLMAGDTVSTISFNPSRLGKYTYLKVRDRANFKGGLVVDGNNGNNNGQLDFNSNITNLISTAQAIPMDIYQVQGVANNVTIDMNNTTFNVVQDNNSVNMSGGGELTMRGDVSAITNMERKNGTLNLDAGTLVDRQGIAIKNQLTLGSVVVDQPPCAQKYGVRELVGAGPNSRKGKLRVLTIEGNCNATPSNPPTTPTCKYVWRDGGNTSHKVECKWTETYSSDAGFYVVDLSGHQKGPLNGKSDPAVFSAYDASLALFMGYTLKNGGLMGTNCTEQEHVNSESGYSQYIDSWMPANGGNGYCPPDNMTGAGYIPYQVIVHKIRCKKECN